MHHHDHEDDRISELPEPILHHIVSFLPTKDATKTSVLSKLWNSVWKSFPVLYFNQNKLNQSVQEFCKYVHDSIKRRRTDVSIRKFKVAINFKNTGFKSGQRDVKRWIKYAVSNNVVHLVLHYFSHKKINEELLYVLPTSSNLFRAKSLMELDLFGCKIVSTGDGIVLSLKKLKLSLVDIDDQTLQSLLLESCGSLEKLTIVGCRGFQSVNLSSDKLERVDLGLGRTHVQKIAIEAPNLRFLSYDGDYENVMRSLEASKFNKNLKELKFLCATITDAIINRVNRDCRFLQKFELIGCVLAGNIRLSDWTMSDRTMDRLKNVELVADCRYCRTKKNGRLDYHMPPGLYKLEV